MTTDTSRVAIAKKEEILKDTPTSWHVIRVRRENGQLEKCKKKAQITLRKCTNTSGLTGWKGRWEKDKPVSVNCTEESDSNAGVLGYIELGVLCWCQVEDWGLIVYRGGVFYDVSYYVIKMYALIKWGPLLSLIKTSMEHKKVLKQAAKMSPFEKYSRKYLSVLNAFLNIFEMMNI